MHTGIPPIIITLVYMYLLVYSVYIGSNKANRTMTLNSSVISTMFAFIQSSFPEKCGHSHTTQGICLIIVNCKSTLCFTNRVHESSEGSSSTTTPKIYWKPSQSLLRHTYMYYNNLDTHT